MAGVTAFRLIAITMPYLRHKSRIKVVLDEWEQSITKEPANTTMNLSTTLGRRQTLAALRACYALWINKFSQLITARQMNVPPPHSFIIS